MWNFNGSLPIGFSFKSNKYRLSFAAALYQDWLERNAKVYGKGATDAEVTSAVHSNLRLELVLGIISLRP